ncbi:hypothetical protein ABFS82_02G033600 [Erythranthe guttata]
MKRTIEHTVEGTVNAVGRYWLKDALSKFILGDIDRKQLDFQFFDGMITLSNLHLNVDCINDKLGKTSILLKEGSIQSIKITFPWKDRGNCRIEVDGIDLVLAPRRVKILSPDKLDADVGDGVDKTIDTMVQRIGSSYDVKVRNLTVAFDPLLEEEKGNTASTGRISVFQISEAKCEARISDSSISTVVNYEGVVLQVLNVDGLNHQLRPAFSPGATTGNMTRIVSGQNGGGVLGNFKLILPRKIDSLDIGKLEADAYIEPHELSLSPSAVRCFVFMWDLFKGMTDEEDTGDGLLLTRIKALQVQLAVENREKRSARKRSAFASLVFIFFVVIFYCVKFNLI